MSGVYPIMDSNNDHIAVDHMYPIPVKENSLNGNMNLNHLSFREILTPLYVYGIILHMYITIAGILIKALRLIQW